jgi:hypothetical protein
LMTRGGYLGPAKKKKRRGKPDGLPLYYGLLVAGTTRLELATSGVTGRRSNQLNYAPVTTSSKLKVQDY